MFGAILNSEIINGKHNNARHVALNRPQKDTCLQYESQYKKA